MYDLFTVIILTRNISLSLSQLAYTLVLKGAIDLAMVRWPANTTLGSSIDVLARRPLWSYGLEYHHGTGHGIGAFLNVHEGMNDSLTQQSPLGL